ncbi:hypothetical protein L6452_08916 [Arctium lappa]|uniref:Uncharacterized protein n=1 Tax=Arctium lappa TaxID=4217 RepID=A0ACB9DIT8_ARCLA|nr:hypothetical protein L6452_08916 [Arctium lappa]
MGKERNQQGQSQSENVERKVVSKDNNDVVIDDNAKFSEEKLRDSSDSNELFRLSEVSKYSSITLQSIMDLMDVVSVKDDFKRVKNVLIEAVNERIQLRSLIKEGLKVCLPDANPKKLYEQDVVLAKEFKICLEIIIQKDEAVDTQRDT